MKIAPVNDDHFFAAGNEVNNDSDISDLSSTIILLVKKDISGDLIIAENFDLIQMIFSSLNVVSFQVGHDLLLDD